MTQKYLYPKICVLGNWEFIDHTHDPTHNPTHAPTGNGGLPLTNTTPKKR